MLEEAVEVIRELWEGGVKSHRGRHYRLEHARIYDLPRNPPTIVVSGFGPAAVDLAARIGDGFCSVQPDADAVEQFRRQAQRGQLVQGSLKVCFDRSEGRAIDTVGRLWPNDGLPGELSQILPTPAHFEQAVELVTPDSLTAEIPCGPDMDRHLEAVRAYAQAGFDELYIQQIGNNQDEFFEAYREHILPQFSSAGELAGRA